MRPHAEIELKWALSPADHQRLGALLAGQLGPPRRLEQRNHFFDSADRRLRGAGLSLRLREENGRLLLTCKQKLPQDGGLHRHLEWEDWIPADLLPPAGHDLPLAGLPLPEPTLAALAGNPVREFASFANQRQEFDSGDELLCLDRTDFMGRRLDHELEIETPDPDASRTRWESRLRAWSIEPAPQLLTKLARLLALQETLAT